MVVTELEIAESLLDCTHSFNNIFNIFNGIELVQKSDIFHNCVEPVGQK